MAHRVAIQYLVVGDPAPGPVLAPVELTLTVEQISVRELIGRAVTEQIHALARQHQANAKVIQMALARHYLTAKDVEVQAAEGRIRLARPQKLGAAPPALNPEQEIAKALDGFEKRAFRVVVDGVMLGSLDDRVALGQDAKVFFLRLMPLVGG